MTILPFIFENINQTITKEKIISDFQAKGLTVTSELKDIVGTGTEIRVAQSNKVYTVLVYGDVNGSGIINLTDAQIIVMHYQNASSYPLSQIQYMAANVANDRDTINLVDAQRVVMLKLGQTTELVKVEPSSIKENDTTPPVISINGQVVTGTQRITMTVGDAYIEPTVTAIDNVDGNVTVNKSGDEVDNNREGTYTVVYTATDAKGNKATVTRVIVVEKRGETPTPVTTVDIEAINSGEVKKDEAVIKKLTVKQDGTKIPVKNSEVSITEIPEGITISKLDAAGNKIEDDDSETEVDSLKIETTIDIEKNVTIKMNIKGIQKVLSFTIPNSIKIAIDSTCEVQIGQSIVKQLEATSGKNGIREGDITISEDAALNITKVPNEDGTIGGINIEVLADKIDEDKDIIIDIIAFNGTEREKKESITVSVYKPIPRAVTLGESKEKDVTIQLYDEQKDGITRSENGLIYTLVPVSLFANSKETKEIFATPAMFTDSKVKKEEKVLIVQPTIPITYIEDGEQDEDTVLKIQYFNDSEVSGKVKYIGIAMDILEDITYNKSDLNGKVIKLICGDATENSPSATITLNYTPNN